MDEEKKSAYGWHEFGDEDNIPDLTQESGRDAWVEILMEQDEWCQAMVVRDDMGNMVARFRYDDGHEEVFDLSIRRELVTSPMADAIFAANSTPDEEQN